MKESKISKVTKKYKTGYIIFSILSVIAFAAPTLWYVIQAFLTTGITTEKVALAGSIMVVLIMSVVALVTKAAPRSRIWIILLGLIICLENIETALIWIASTQILDELVLCPAKKFFKDRMVINKQIDKRSV